MELLRSSFPRGSAGALAIWRDSRTGLGRFRVKVSSMQVNQGLKVSYTLRMSVSEDRQLQAKIINSFVIDLVRLQEKVENLVARTDYGTKEVA